MAWLGPIDGAAVRFPMPFLNAVAQITTTELRRVLPSESTPDFYNLKQQFVSSTGSITTCDDNTNYTLNPNELNIGDTITIRNLEVTAGGSVNIL